MGLVTFTFEREATARFIDLGYDLYRGDPGWVPPLRVELQAQLSPAFPFYARSGNDHRRFLALAGGHAVARVMATVNGARRGEDGAAEGAVGLFEAARDDAAAEDVLGAAVEWLRAAYGVRRVRGPLNFDIWHGYRFMTRGFERERFFGEPCNKPYYPDVFERLGFTVCRRWSSFELPGSVPAEGLSSSRGLSGRDFVARGYRFEAFGRYPFDERVALLHHVLTQSFSSFPGYTPIALAEFRELMSLARHVLHPRCSTFVFDETGALAGFTAVFVDVADAVRAMNGSSSLAGRLRFLWRRRRASRLLFHLGGITPAEARRHTGLACAAFHHTLDLIRAERCDAVVASLVARGNPVRRLFGAYARDAFREYALYERAA
ncbi:MAG TPA: hypothetical protein VFT38_21895 [Vicinamibacteria bacterium]|nr:hypothetical protein [Vicinamibacteria bacterium]